MPVPRRALATKLNARGSGELRQREGSSTTLTVLADLDNGGIATIAARQITIGAQSDNGFQRKRERPEPWNCRSPTTTS